MHIARIAPIACVWLLTASSAFAFWTWQTLDYPGAVSTGVYGVSDGSTVGSYKDATGTIRGFLHYGSTWKPLQYPGAGLTCAYGVFRGNIVGLYMTGPFQERGFLYDGSKWTTLLYPGAASTRACGIYENRIVGYYDDASGKTHGFVYDGKTWQQLDYPSSDATDTMARGIWGNRIVGSCYPFGGVIYDGSWWPALLAPGMRSTTFFGVYQNQMVGLCQEWAGPVHTFLRDGNTWTYIEYPGGTAAQARSIWGDRIVGTYRDTPTGHDHGFLLTSPNYPPSAGPAAACTNTKLLLPQVPATGSG